MAVVELTTNGESWGRGPVDTAHSSISSWIDCLPFRLAQALPTFTDAKGCGLADF